MKRIVIILFAFCLCFMPTLAQKNKTTGTTKTTGTAKTTKTTGTTKTTKTTSTAKTTPKGESTKKAQEYYDKGVELSKTQTVDYQNMAIDDFKLARNYYVAKSMKKVCNNAIASCQNTIKLIKQKNKTVVIRDGGSKKDDTLTKTDSESNVNKNKAKVELSVNENVVKFKAKGEFKKVKVTCNYSDWNVTEHPDWISCSVNSDGEIVLDAAKNSKREERSGMVKIACRGTEVSFAVLQSKRGLF